MNICSVGLCAENEVRSDIGTGRSCFGRDWRGLYAVVTVGLLSGWESGTRPEVCLESVSVEQNLVCLTMQGQCGAQVAVIQTLVSSKVMFSHK